MSFNFPQSSALYGIPEREAASLRLHNQFKYGDDPYRLFNSDEFRHKSGDNKALYGSVPYIYARGNTTHSAILWLNSAETWVDIYDDSSSFVSESGQLDVVMFAASSPKQLLTKLAQITGFAPLPPIYSLGFHFSKYDETSA